MTNIRVTKRYILDGEVDKLYLTCVYRNETEK